MTYITLSYTDLAVAAVLVILNAALSIGLRLGLEWRLLIAAGRMVVQLALVALVLKALFAVVSPLFTAAAALVMVLFAGREVMARQTRRFTGLWAYGLGTTSILAAATIVTVLALTTQVKPDPWYDPRYAIPLLGMVLGNTMTGVSLGLDRLVTAAARERSAIEARLALGQEFSEAMGTITRDALRGGLMPIINAMSAAGLVSLPGMMTGQILAGVDPVEAVKYQILIMFLIAGGTGLGVLAAVLGGVRRLTDGRHRLRLDRLTLTTGA
ncbi:MAG: iron export ABC transporter permease subunit FetB [Proteobacteria bacterium]|nr:iron export ABC transporter permease subunit FetB [Pseudomonadota bacterium]